MKDALPRDLIERLLEEKYPNARYILNSVVARRRERVYVSRRDAALYDEIAAYKAELLRRPDNELLDRFERLCALPSGDESSNPALAQNDDLSKHVAYSPEAAARYAPQFEEKRNAGRYTLEEAASMLEQHAGERANTVLHRLVKAVKTGLLPVHRPGEKMRYELEEVKGYYEEVYWDDVNVWLAARAAHRLEVSRTSPQCRGGH